MVEYFGKGKMKMTENIFQCIREMTQYFEKSKREMTQDILKVLYGNEPILLKVLTDFDSILCERVMPKYIGKY